MATEIGGAVYVFDAQIDGVKRGMAAVKAEFRSVQKDADRVAKNTDAAMRTLGSSMTSLLGAAADPSKISQRWAKATGMMASDMDKVAAAAKADGMSFAEATNRMIYFNRESYRARSGTGALAEALKKYHPEAATMMRLTSSTTERQAILNSVLAKTTDATARATIQNAAFGTGLSKADANAKGLTGTMGGMGRAMTALLTLGALQQVGAATVAAVRAVADIGDAAANAGMSTDEIQQLQYAFAQTGISAEDSAAGIDRFTVQLANARKGEGELYDFLTANNVALTDREGVVKSNYDVMLDFADAISKTRNAEDQLAIAVSVFGKNAGRKFIEALRAGKSALEALAIAAQDSGTIVQESQIKAADAIEKRYNALFEALTKKWQSFAVSVGETAISMIDGIAKAGKAVETFVGPRLAAALGFNDGGLADSALPGYVAPPAAKAEPVNTQSTAGGKSALPDTIDLSKGGTLKKTIDDQTKSFKVSTPAIEENTKALKYEANAQAMLADATQQAIDKAKDEIAAKREVADFLNGELKTSFFDIIHGSKSVGDAIVEMSQRMIDAMLEATLFGSGPFADFLGSTGKGGSPGGGIGSIIGSVFGLGKAAMPSLYAAGGPASGPVIVGEEGPELLNLPGGSTITPTEQVGNRIRDLMAASQRPAMASAIAAAPAAGNLRIIVNNNAPADVSVEESSGPGGERQLLMTIDARVSRQLSDPYAQSAGALRARGANTPVKRR